MTLLKDLLLINENKQGRVLQGSVGQQVVVDYLKREYGDRLDIISIAPKHSKAPDIVATLDGERFQVEVKSRDSFVTPMVLFNSTVRRGAPSPREDAFVSAFEKDQAHLEDTMDYYRYNDDPTVGFPDDPNSPPSGKFPKQWRTQDANTLSRIRRLIIRDLQNSGNNYLAIRVNDHVAIFWTGLGSNVLNEPKIPSFRYSLIDTYGEGYRGAIRFAVRCAL